ncbi:MAG: serine hydrolase domain-containing protein [Thermoanaerobaculia bacterium]
MNRTVPHVALVAIVLATFVSSAVARADTPLAERPGVRDAITVADLWIREQVAYHGIPGVAVAIVSGDETVWTNGYGVADLATGEPVTPHTRFRLGSVSKLFTASAILLLRDEGRLSLDDPASRFLPWFRPESPFPGNPPVTIEQLLTHTSGLPRDAPLPYWSTHDFPTREELRASLPGIRLLSRPGETYRYSNLGISLLGEIVAAASGRDWETFVERRILAPLGMAESRADLSASELDGLARAYLHRQPDGPRREAIHYETHAISPAASVVSTAADLARFAAFQLTAADESSTGTPPLPPATLREMQRVHFVYPSWSGGRGLGFGVTRRDGRTYPSHAGWIGGHRTDFLLDPARRIAAVAMTNADDASPSLFTRKLLDLVGGAIAAATAQPAPPRATDPAWARLTGRYTDPWGWEYEVLVLDGALAFYEHDYPPDDDPDASINRLTAVGPNEFRMADGEPVVFETDAEGAVVRIRRRFETLTPVR